MKDLGLNITIEFGPKVVDFLLVINFELNTSSFKLFRKSNNTPCKINKDSNHPPNSYPRWSTLGSVDCHQPPTEIFREAAPVCQAGLARSSEGDKVV